MSTWIFGSARVRTKRRRLTLKGVNGGKVISSSIVNIAGSLAVDIPLGGFHADKRPAHILDKPFDSDGWKSARLVEALLLLLRVLLP